MALTKPLKSKTSATPAANKATTRWPTIAAKVSPSGETAWPPIGPTFEEGMIVGLLLARGSFTGDKHQGRLAILSADLVMLQWIKSRIGGTISGPYEQKGRNPHHMYQLSGQALHPVIELLSAWMPAGNQRTRYVAWLAKYPALMNTAVAGAIKAIHRQAS